MSLQGGVIRVKGMYAWKVGCTGIKWKTLLLDSSIAVRSHRISTSLREIRRRASFGLHGAI